MYLVDTHCHIQSIASGEAGDHTHELWVKSGYTANGVVEAAREAHITKLICVGCDLNDSRLATSFAAKYPQCSVAIGIHPHEAKRYTNRHQTRQSLVHLLQQAKSKIVAIGECGLDYYYHHSTTEDQAAVLRLQLDLAAEYDLPVIFHVREAFADFWTLLKPYQPIRGVLHSFTDSLETLQQAISIGLFIGVNGIATFNKNRSYQELIKAIPLERLLLETDAPYLTPVPYRGTINQPKQIRTIAEFLAVLRGESIQQIAEATSANANLLFRL